MRRGRGHQPGSMMNNFISRSSTAPLKVNIDPNYHYMVEKSEAQGIRDLQALAIKSEKTKVAEVEEAWIYIKGKDRARRIKEFWFEVGYNESPKKVMTSSADLDKIVKLLKERGIKVERWVHYHYHPIPKSKSGKTEFGTLFPSIGDTSSIVDSYPTWRDYQLAGTYQKAVVTKHGVWRTEWKGPTLKSDAKKAQTYRKLLGEHAVRTRRSLNFWVDYCLGPGGPCRDFYKGFGHHFSTPWTKVRFQPIDIKRIPKGRIFPRLGKLNKLVRTANPKNYFQKLLQQIAKDNEELQGHQLGIKWDDGETIASVVNDKSGERRVYFNFVIDTNHNPKDGRIYMVDIYWFNKANKYIGFNRYFTYKPHLANAKYLENMAKRYAKTVTMPTHGQRRAFAKEVAGRFLKL